MSASTSSRPLSHRYRRSAALLAGLALLGSSVGVAQVVNGSPAVAADSASCDVVPSTAAGASPIVGADLGDEDSGIFDFITSVASNAVADGATDGAGWLLSLMLGNGGGDGDDSALLANQQAQQQQLDAIQASVNALADQLTDAEYAIKAQLTQSTYDELVASEDQNISAIQASVQAVCNLASEASTYNVTNPYLPDSTDINTITTLRDSGLGYLDDLSSALLGSNGAEGIIAVYRQAVWDGATISASSPPSQSTWTSAYLDAMHALLDYYVNLSGQLFNAYAEAVHWQNAASPGVDALAPDNSDKIGQFYTQLQLDILSWTDAATSNLPTIPEGTAIDFKSGSNGVYNLWTTEPVQDLGTNSNQFCLTPASLCVYNVWEASASPSSVVSTTIVPSVIPVSNLLAMNPLGLTGWRIPSAADWQSWVAPAYTGTGPTTVLSGLDPNSGVAAWAAAEQIPVLTAQSFTVPEGGSIATIPPVLVDGDSDSVYSFNDPASASPTTMTPATGTGYAGQLVLVTSLTATPPDLPATVPTTTTTTTAGTRFSISAGTPTEQAPTQTVTAPEVLGTTGTLFQWTTFSSASSCSTNAFTQPAGANAVRVTVTGGTGGGGWAGGSHNAGGSGAQISAVLPLSAGATIYAQVGANGGSGYQNGDNGEGNTYWAPGGGGFGGGGPGGQVIPTGIVFAGAGGGGGGFSGISADAGCSQWLTIAGGGGGAGGMYEHSSGSDGGNGCVQTGCAGQSLDKVGDDTGGGTGGTLISAGSAGEHDGNYAGPGTNGGRFDGGTGGTGGNGSSNPFHDWGGGSGGGGGGGWGSGGGGGGSTGDYAGAGGGGGGSYLASGVAQASFTTSDAGPSVSIQPVLGDEYAITQTDGHRWIAPDNGAGQSITSINPFIWSDLEEWALLPVTPGADSYQIANGPAALCASSTGGALTGEPCAYPASAPSSQQDWTFQPQAGALAILDDQGDAAFGAGASPASITFGPWQDVNWSTWNLTLSPDTIWAAPGAPSPLGDVDASEPSPPAATPAAPGSTAAAASGATQLAATGTASVPLILALALIATAGGMVLVVGLRHSPRHRRT
ncbi:hypothetical protein NY547_09290 [Cnuibacter physcomitrellae]|uniref:hypothetical protein n=1 Tax=Cnuibacter physcomitrellae TaxID=1619308 RepID=UPI0021759EC4|nr:hypothetical protein [Cnuibacter physcomitrellae]MCS5497429.1 hypothetical protein [Cnuibacter physcomitrellae]